MLRFLDAKESLVGVGDLAPQVIRCHDHDGDEDDGGAQPVLDTGHLVDRAHRRGHRLEHEGEDDVEGANHGHFGRGLGLERGDEAVLLPASKDGDDEDGEGEVEVPGDKRQRGKSAVGGDRFESLIVEHVGS